MYWTFWLNNTEHLFTKVECCLVMFSCWVVKRTEHFAEQGWTSRYPSPTAHARTEQMFSDWSNALNNTQHFEKQRKCWVALHLFSEMFDRDQTSLNKIQQGWTRLNKVVKRSEHFAVNKCSVLFSEMFSTFDWGLRKSGKRTSYFHDNYVQQCKQYKSYKDKTFLRNLQMHMYLL